MYFWGRKTFWRKGVKPHLKFTEFPNNLGPDFKLKHIWNNDHSKHVVHVLEESLLKLNNYKKPQAEPTPGFSTEARQDCHQIWCQQLWQPQTELHNNDKYQTNWRKQGWGKCCSPFPCSPLLFFLAHPCVNDSNKPWKEQLASSWHIEPWGSHCFGNIGVFLIYKVHMCQSEGLSEPLKPDKQRQHLACTAGSPDPVSPPFPG